MPRDPLIDEEVRDLVYQIIDEPSSRKRVALANRLRKLAKKITSEPVL